MKFLELFKSSAGQKAQHTIEYVILLTLIMAGIIITGPYVVRSWNANLKGWGDSTVDSLQEPLLGGPSITLEGCESQGWFDAACGSGREVDRCTGVPIPCSKREMASIQLFVPDGCECNIRPTPPPTLRCTASDCCCTTPVKTDPLACGTNASAMGAPLDPCHNSGMTPKNSDGTCPDEMAEASVFCGNNSAPVYGCIRDPDCKPQCEGTPGSNPPYGDMCPEDNQGLTQHTQITYVNPGGCTPGRLCEWECSSNPDGGPYFAAQNGTLCRSCKTPGIPTNGCPAGQYNYAGCNPGEYLPCCYAP